MFDKMPINLYMLGAIMLDRIIRDVDG
jgi:hypothetical protein